MIRGRLHPLLGCLVVGLFVSVLALASGAGAASPEQVTIKADETFFAVGDPLITISASGGVFGNSSTGTATSVNNTQGSGSTTSSLHRRAIVYHGVDVYTTTDGDAKGAITFKWQFTCKYTSDTDNTCSGPWHITSGTGAYKGAQGGGTAVDLCVDNYDAGGAYLSSHCNDILTGKIQVP